ncbi:MAG: serine hydrolase [Longimicrobiales bacterium]
MQGLMGRTGRGARHERFGLLGLIVCAACMQTPSPQSASIPLPDEPIIAPSRSLKQLDSLLRARIARLDSGEVAIAIADLETGIRFGINEHISMHAASTMKVPVMLELFRQTEQKGLRLTDSIPVVNEFTSIADQSKFALSQSEDSDSTLYARVGQRESMRLLVQLMIARSSNLATNILIEHVRTASIRSTLTAIDAQGMNVLRGVEDGPAFRRGLNNTTTADGFARTLEAIARCRLTTRATCTDMVEILAIQEFNDMIPAGLPAGTRVAHKTGWITGSRHDGGIIYPPERAPYVLVVLTRGIADTLSAARLGADLSRIVWTSLTAPTFALPDVVPSARLLIEQHRRFRNPTLAERRFRQDDLLAALEPYTNAPLEREEVGKSASGKPLYLYRFGNGPTRVLLWSQMHGNESTATLALTDLARYLHESGSARVRDWAQYLTIAFLPMLNPDGADRYQRQNDLGIDVNRDARALATPEARALKAVHDRFRPHFGFNLHDQNPRTRVGNTDRLAAISLLAPPKDASRTDDEQMLEAKRMAATLRRALAPLVGGHITRYDDAFNARAFGDLMQSWGTRTVLIESGGWRGDPEKQYLRTVNFVALLTALDAITDNSYRQTPLELYSTLPPNGRSVNDVVIVGGQIVVPGLQPYRADISADFQEYLGQNGPLTVVEMGDLEGVHARDTIDVSGRYLHPAWNALHEMQQPRRRYMGPGSIVNFAVSDSADPYGAVLGFIEQGRYRPVARNEVLPAEPKPSIAACYEVALGEWPGNPARLLERERDTSRPHERIELMWRYATDPGSPRALVVRPLPPIPATPFRFHVWRLESADSVSITWSSGLNGISLHVARDANNGLKGVARLLGDAATEGGRAPETTATLRRLPCPGNVAAPAR